MAEKRNALVKINQDIEDASKKLETAKEVTEIVQYVPLRWLTRSESGLPEYTQHVKLKSPREKQLFVFFADQNFSLESLKQSFLNQLEGMA